MDTKNLDIDFEEVDNEEEYDEDFVYELILDKIKQLQNKAHNYGFKLNFELTRID